MLEKILQSANYIKEQIKETPEIGIILGTGLGGLVTKINAEVTIPYKEIPNFPVSTVKGHGGNLIIGKLNGVQVVALQGRFHYYEGYTAQEITFPVRVMKYLGIKRLFVSNASGGVNPEFAIGDIMIITDHINFIPNPLIGPNNDELGPRFPDMSDAYDKEMIKIVEDIANELGITIRKGVYCAVTGPTFETPAEYKFFRIIGADTVGMSTTPEVIVARHMNLPVFAVSIITDLGVPGKIVKVTHEDVLKAAKNSESKMTLIIKELISRLK